MLSSLAQLGPAPKGEISPEQADMVDDHLAAGDAGGYRFRYRIVSPVGGDSSAQDGFELSAVPDDYGKLGKRSFFLDASGTIHGADKHGDMAAASDPVVMPPPDSPDSGNTPTAQ
jgi:hypothetical protein